MTPRRMARRKRRRRQRGECAGSRPLGRPAASVTLNKSMTAAPGRRGGAALGGRRPARVVPKDTHGDEQRGRRSGKGCRPS